MDDIRIPSPAELSAAGPEAERFRESAAAVTRLHFGRKVFVRGVVEVSNFCRENCSYCGMRRDRRDLGRFRLEPEALADALLGAVPASVTDLNIQTGEDPIAVREVVLPLIERLRRETRLGISVCLGTLSAELTAALQAAGATVYIVKFETADADHYREMSAPGTLSERIRFIRDLHAAGWHVSSGFIAGLPGQDMDRLLANFRLAASLPLVGCSVSPFIPGDDTPLAGRLQPPVDLTLNCMAGLRLLGPGWVIPAVSALNLADPGMGYRRGLRAGANLCTMNLTPESVRGDYVIYQRDRFIMTEERILAALEAEGLVPSTDRLADHYARAAAACGAD